MTLLLQSYPARAMIWKQVFAAAGLPIETDPAAISDPSDITALACWLPPEDLSIYPNLKAVLSVGAGVDQMPQLPPEIMLCRSLAPGIERLVRDWVVMACLMLHRDIPLYLAQSALRLWQGQPVTLSSRRRVGILGLGRIGKLVAQSLRDLGFPVCGWSRSGDPVDGVTVYGQGRLPEVLAQSDILICLLPLTEATRNLLNADCFDALPKGAHLVQAGRGAQLNMADLKVALDSGQLASAMLDVTNPEPLPGNHWAWADPRIVITPHVAAETDAAQGAAHAVEVMRALMAGEAPPGLIDQTRGY